MRYFSFGTMAAVAVLAMSFVLSAMNTKKNKISKEDKEGYCLVRQTLGPELGYNEASGVKIIEKDGLAFKSFGGSDTLLPYEDWRLPAEKRAEDLASRLSLDEIAGLMLYSPQNKLFTADLVRAYCDGDNNVYKFAFGLNWKGVIKDKRTKQYDK